MTKKITVLLPDQEFERFDRYCENRGFKKSTLLAKLVRDLMDADEGIRTVVQVHDSASHSSKREYRLTRPRLGES